MFLLMCYIPYPPARAWDAAALGGTAPNGPGRLREALGSGVSELGLSLLAQLLCLDPLARITVGGSLRTSTRPMLNLLPRLRASS